MTWIPYSGNEGKQNETAQRSVKKRSENETLSTETVRHRLLVILLRLDHQLRILWRDVLCIKWIDICKKNVSVSSS